MDLKCGAVEKLRQGGGTARFTQTCAGEEQKMCLSRAGFDTSTTVPKPPVLDVASVKCDQKKPKRESGRRFPVAGRARTHRLDLELPFRAAVARSCRCLPSDQQQAPPFFPLLTHPCLQKTRLSTPISPP